MIQYDIDWLKKNYQMVHYFGLGFIQLKLDATYRMHFYTPELPPIVPEEDIHNHRYSFSSSVLKGVFYQEIFELVEGDTHVCEEESCSPDSPEHKSGRPCGIKSVSSHAYVLGSHYWVHHSTFHRVRATNCVTLLTRGVREKPHAEVVRSPYAPKVCPFSQKVKEETLWEMMERMIKS